MRVIASNYFTSSFNEPIPLFLPTHTRHVQYNPHSIDDILLRIPTPNPSAVVPMGWLILCRCSCRVTKFASGGGEEHESIPICAFTYVNMWLQEL